MAAERAGSTISTRPAARLGSSPRARAASWNSGARLPALVARSSPSTQISTPAGSTTKKALASTRESGTASVSVASAAMLTARVSVR